MQEPPAPSRRPSARHSGRRTWALLPLLAASLLAACSASGPGSDMASADLLPPIDLTAGPSCGKIITCIIQCGLGKIECDTLCGMGASVAESSKAGALAFCAATHCLSTDGGTGVPAILGCLLTNCQSQVTACDGLF